MWCQYDENLGENPFFKEIQDNHSDIIERATEENWIICVPRNGTIELCDISIETILDHVLLHGTESDFSTLSKKLVSIKNKRIYLDPSQLFANNVEILFEETFYLRKSTKYIVWCIDRPLFLKINCNSHTSTVLETLHDCIDFLWVESMGHDILDNIRRLTENFIQENKDLELESLQTQKEIIGNLYSQCLQISLKSVVMREKSLKSSQFLENLKISVETYMQYCLGKKLVFSVNTLQYQTDAFINKLTRNSNSLHSKDLNIPEKLYDVVTLAKCELNKINKYVTVLDKMYCLKQTFAVMYKVNKSDDDHWITTDDLLQILVFLVLKLNISNWSANLVFMEEFRFSLMDNSDQNSYCLASLEAAIEFVKSNKFLYLKNDAFISSIYLNSSQLSVQTIFDQIKSGRLTNLKSICKNSSEPKLCHPLCSCDMCQSVMKDCEAEYFSPLKSNEKGQNLLIIASLLGDCDVVEFLLAEDFDVNFSDYQGKTSLHYAASRGFQDILLLLINAGANVNALDSEKNTALHLACNNGQETCVKALIYSSTDLEVNVGNFFGDTPLHLATKWGYSDIVKILLENGASLIICNKRNQTVLNVASNYYILKLFEEFGMERSTTICKRIKECSPTLINERCVSNACSEHGVKPKNVDQFKKIDLLLKAIEGNDLPLTCFYLGFSCNTSTIVKRSDCHPLCDCEKCLADLDISEDIPQKPAPAIHINTCNAEGHTPLHIAAKFGRTDILRLLLDSGALPNVQTYKTLYTPLHLACFYQRIQVVRELLKCGSCLIDCQDAKGNTPLFYACVKNDIKIVEILLSNGADCTKKNYSGKSPLQESEENMQYRVFKLMKNSLVNFLQRDNVYGLISSDVDVF